MLARTMLKVSFRCPQSFWEICGLIGSCILCSAFFLAASCLSFFHSPSSCYTCSGRQGLWQIFSKQLVLRITCIWRNFKFWSWFPALWEEMDLFSLIPQGQEAIPSTHTHGVNKTPWSKQIITELMNYCGKISFSFFGGCRRSQVV